MKTFNELTGFGPAKYLGHHSTHVCWKGGGDTVESTPDWYKPYVEKAAGSAVDAYDAGELSKVAGLNTQQREGIDAYSTAANRADTNYMNATGANDVLGKAARGEGIYGAGATEGLKNSAIADARSAWGDSSAKIASSGALGGARAGILKNQRDNDLANTLAGIDYKDLSDRRGLSTDAAQGIVGNTDTLQKAGGAAADYQGKAGGLLQEQQQRELDASYQGLQRLGGLLSGAPEPQQQQKSGGK